MSEVHGYTHYVAGGSDDEANEALRQLEAEERDEEREQRKRDEIQLLNNEIDADAEASAATVAVRKRGREQQQQYTCPSCRCQYEPDLPMGDPSSTPIQREQHITHICCDACWDTFLGGVQPMCKCGKGGCLECFKYVAIKGNDTKMASEEEEEEECDNDDGSKNKSCEDCGSSHPEYCSQQCKDEQKARDDKDEKVIE